MPPLVSTARRVWRLSRSGAAKAPLQAVDRDDRGDRDRAQLDARCCIDMCGGRERPPLDLLAPPGAGPIPASQRPKGAILGTIGSDRSPTPGSPRPAERLRARRPRPPRRSNPRSARHRVAGARRRRARPPTRRPRTPHSAFAQSAMSHAHGSRGADRPCDSALNATHSRASWPAAASVRARFTFAVRDAPRQGSAPGRRPRDARQRQSRDAYGDHELHHGGWRSSQFAANDLCLTNAATAVAAMMSEPGSRAATRQLREGAAVVRWSSVVGSYPPPRHRGTHPP